MVWDFGITSTLIGADWFYDQPDYMGGFILYRRNMQTGWSGLTQELALPDRLEDPAALNAGSDYADRNFHYVRAMDRLARLKSRDIVGILNPDSWCGPILDVGGGCGALCRELVRSQAAIGRQVTAILHDLPEVIDVARSLYPQQRDWHSIGVVEGDFRNHDFTGKTSFGLVLLGNFLHAYAEKTARQLLIKAVDLTAPEGILLIHDYFPDRTGRRPHKGALYDLNMMLNTFDGGCQPAAKVIEWLRAAGMPHFLVQDLESDSTLLLAGRSERVEEMLPEVLQDRSKLEVWPAVALQLGFSRAELVRTDQVRTATLSREKCRYGCAGYGRNRMCPPHGIDHAAMAKILAEYRWALLVVSTPPGRQFHDQLLTLEKRAFLAGLHKALAFGAGPCPVCVSCPEGGLCRHPDMARPSMEGSGIDVYETAREAGIHLQPVTNPERFVKYVGMVLLPEVESARRHACERVLFDSFF